MNGKHSLLPLLVVAAVSALAALAAVAAPVAAQTQYIDWHAGDSCDDWTEGCDGEGRAVLPEATVGGAPWYLITPGSNTYYLSFETCEYCTLDAEIELVSGTCDLSTITIVVDSNIPATDLPYTGSIYSQLWEMKFENQSQTCEFAISSLTLVEAEQSALTVNFDSGEVFDVAGEMVTALQSLIHILAGLTLGFVLVRELYTWLRLRF